MNEKIIIYLLTFCILIILIKKNNILKIEYININTLLFWTNILLSSYLTLLISNKKNIYNIKKQILLGFIIYNLIFWFQEYLYFFNKISIRSEKEALSNSYDWFNFTMHQDNFNTKKGDLTEGLYNNNYKISAEEAMLNKYDTYYKWLNLAPGKTLVDLGSGYCHWLIYCKNKGVIVKGVNLSKPQRKFCKKRNIEVILSDYRYFIKNTEEKFDAVSTIGTQEHLASMGMTPQQESEIHNEMLKNIHRIVKVSGRVLISLCLMNPNYPKWKIYSSKEKGKPNKISLIDKIHIYNLTHFYGCGRYPLVPDYNSYVKNCFNIVKIKNYTEDYRWAGINFGDHHWQNGKIYINTPYRFLKLIEYFFTDMWFFPRINYSLMKSWYWTLGGNQKTPIYNNNKSPILANIYVLEPKPKGCIGQSNPKALQVY